MRPHGQLARERNGETRRASSIAARCAWHSHAVQRGHSPVTPCSIAYDDRVAVGVESALPEALYRWQQASLAHGALLPIRSRITWAWTMRKAPMEIAAQPRSAQSPTTCGCCSHAWTAHDATAQRYCNATLAAALSRGCICRNCAGQG
jgi:hypothetical protein